jgi:hypothetical protein
MLQVAEANRHVPAEGDPLYALRERRARIRQDLDRKL